MPGNSSLPTNPNFVISTMTNITETTTAGTTTSNILQNTLSTLNYTASTITNTARSTLNSTAVSARNTTNTSDDSTLIVGVVCAIIALLLIGGIMFCKYKLSHRSTVNIPKRRESKKDTEAQRISDNSELMLLSYHDYSALQAEHHQECKDSHPSSILFNSDTHSNNTQDRNIH